MINLYHKYEEIINYLFFGVLTTIVSLLVYYGLVFTILDPKSPLQLQISNILSWCAGVLFAYFTNRRFVFKSNSENKVKEFITFTSARIITLLLDMFIMFIFVTVLKGNDKIFKLVSQALVVIGNYILSKLVVFKRKKWKRL